MNVFPLAIKDSHSSSKAALTFIKPQQTSRSSAPSKHYFYRMAGPSRSSQASAKAHMQMPFRSKAHPDDIFEAKFREMVTNVVAVDRNPKTERANEWKKFDYQGVLYERKHKDWGVRPPLPVADQGDDCKGDGFHYLPVPNTEGLTMERRWATSPWLLAIIMFDRMQYGAMTEVLESDYHPAPKWLVTKTLAKIKWMYREYWYMEEEDVEAIYQELRGQRAQDFINVDIAPTVPFDAILGLVLHARLGHFQESRNPAQLEVPVRKGCFPWAPYMKVKIHASWALDASFERFIPLKWSRKGDTFKEWLRQWDERDPEWAKRPWGPGGPLGLSIPFPIQPPFSSGPDDEDWTWTGWGALNPELHAFLHPPSPENSDDEGDEGEGGASDEEDDNGGDEDDED